MKSLVVSTAFGGRKRGETIGDPVDVAILLATRPTFVRVVELDTNPAPSSHAVMLAAQAEAQAKALEEAAKAQENSTAVQGEQPAAEEAHNTEEGTPE
jgi:hypothetical protein